MTDRSRGSDATRREQRDQVAIDATAAEAARIFAEGSAATVEEALRLVVQRRAVPKALQPSLGRVRQHVEARSMARLGWTGEQQRRQQILASAEEIMSLLDEVVPHTGLLLAGRAAAGRLDGEAALHIRILTVTPIGTVASVLVDAGYEEPRFRTLRTTLGRLDALEFHEGEIAVSVTRCPPISAGRSALNLYTGRPVETLDLAALRVRLAAH